MPHVRTSLVFAAAAAASLAGSHAYAGNAAGSAAPQAREAPVNAEGSEIVVNGRAVTFCTREDLRSFWASRSCLSRERSRQLLRR